MVEDIKALVKCLAEIIQTYELLDIKRQLKEKCKQEKEIN